MPKLALLDGLSLAYRAFYALPADLATTAGQVTNAVFGFTSMLIKLLDDERPDAVAVAWDLRTPTFRKEQYPEYKAQRESPPDLFAEQLPLIREVLEVLNVPQLSVEGFEADDVIATLAVEATREDWDVVVVTGDRDAFQIVDRDVRVLYTRRGISDTVEATPAWIEERYGIGPDRYVQYAALRGDTSDNLPGVPGVGEKTAAKLLGNYGSIDGIYDHLDEQTPKLRENLAASREQVYLNQELMTLRRDVDVDFPADGFRRRPWDHAAVREVFDGLAFRTLWDRLVELEGDGASDSGAEVLDIEAVTERDPSKLAQLLQGAEHVAIELVREGGALAGVMCAANPSGPGYYVPVEVIDRSLADVAPRGFAAHDAKSVLRALAALDVAMPVAFDTALAAYVVNPAQRVADLAELASRELGLEVDSVDDAQAETGDQSAFDFEESGPDLEAAARRAVAVLRLIPALTDQVEARGASELYRTIELPLVSVLAAMEHRGIAVDVAYLQELRTDLVDRLSSLEADIHEAAGEPFNINSTLQLKEILFDKLELPILKKTPKGAPSTDASVLKKLAEDHELPRSLLQYRELEKLRSTYVDGLLPLVEPDGRIHGSFNQMAAATGRLSSEQPNLQNIPIRSEEGRTIRRAFVAAPDMAFVVADYSQIELRILAHMSGDAGLVEAFNNDDDIHQATAARVFGVPSAEVGPEQRRRAKVINFGLLYGMEAFGLAQRLEIPQEEAKEHVEAYFSQFPDVREFMSGIVSDAKRAGYTTTLLGRRRYLPELSSSNFRNRQMGERMALNAPIQGTAADIIKKAMVELEGRFPEHVARMLVQIHDELVFEVGSGEIDAVTKEIRGIMEGIIELDVPLRVDTASGPTLADCMH